jgi:hypothetical protein
MLSEWLERHVMKRVDRQKRQLAEDKAAADVSTPPRQITSFFLADICLICVILETSGNFVRGSNSTDGQRSNLRETSNVNGPEA